MSSSREIDSVIVTVEWGYDQHSLELSGTDWAKIMSGKHLKRKGDGYYYEGKRYKDYWYFGGGEDSDLYVTYGNDGSVGFDGSLSDADIEITYENGEEEELLLSFFSASNHIVSNNAPTIRPNDSMHFLDYDQSCFDGIMYGITKLYYRLKNNILYIRKEDTTNNYSTEIQLPVPYNLPSEKAVLADFLVFLMSVPSNFVRASVCC